MQPPFKGSLREWRAMIDAVFARRHDHGGEDFYRRNARKAVIPETGGVFAVRACPAIGRAATASGLRRL